MGWRENVAKALNLPAGTTTQTEQQIASQVPASGTTATAMERRAEDYVVPFAPGRPLVPSLINPPLDSGRAAPRRYEFPGKSSWEKGRHFPTLLRARWWWGEV